MNDCERIVQFKVIKESIDDISKKINTTSSGDIQKIKKDLMFDFLLFFRDRWIENTDIGSEKIHEIVWDELILNLSK